MEATTQLTSQTRHNPLTAIHAGNLTDDLLGRYIQTAAYFARTGWFNLTGDIETRKAQAFAKLMAGAEMGLGPMASMRYIHALSDGKIELHAILVAALIKRSGKYDYRVIERSNKACRVKFYERTSTGWEELGESHWTVERAKQAELGGSRTGKKSNWDKHPQSMLFARCMTDGERTYCPDVAMVGPLYALGEIDTYEHDTPDVIDVARQILNESPADLGSVDPISFDGQVSTSNNGDNRRLVASTETSQGSKAPTTEEGYLAATKKLRSRMQAVLESGSLEDIQSFVDSATSWVDIWENTEWSETALSIIAEAADVLNEQDIDSE